MEPRDKRFTFTVTSGLTHCQTRCAPSAEAERWRNDMNQNGIVGNLANDVQCHVKDSVEGVDFMKDLSVLVERRPRSF